MLVRLLLFAKLAVLAAILLAPTVGHARAPTNEEQLMLEMVNRMRADPQTELSKLVNIITAPTIAWGNPKSSDVSTTQALNSFAVDPVLLYNQWQLLTPAPPVAWNENLAVSSQTYSNLMIALDQQAHNLDEHKFPNGDVDILGRLEASGYTFPNPQNYSAGESIFAYANNVFHGHAAFAVDWGAGPGGIQNPAGHRDLIMDASMREIGIGIVAEFNGGTQVGPRVITQHYAFDGIDTPFLTGVVYRESDNNNFYSVGEGLGNITIVATDTVSGQKFTTMTYGSGGYNLELPAGRSYNLVASGPGLGQFSASGLFLGTDNVKFDFITNSMPLLGDANMDGLVNRRDLAVVANNFGTATDALWGNGDFTGDGKVTLADLLIVRNNFSPGGSPVAVPEPSSLMLGAIAFALVGFAGFRRRQTA